ncbi:PREDICTED: uncharacterized protein LOC106817080 [Priapulus caudatus]|uniref:Uncharacterized protein LOC106817080 n=1 Tax=Priapulus caudatus TaxID=37621 RepID=A0ABM1EYE2_PRICU|nr:PREDICTED: uncharacterized protein LOC106817080 [Priapulus caudatus]
MAEMLKVSTKTIHRRMRQFGLVALDRPGHLPEEELDQVVKDAMSDNRRIGANGVHVKLRNKGINVPRDKVRESVRRVDPFGVALRSRRTLKRREYSVKGPNSLWHIDGNMKLIRWRIAVHGAVDGYSRLIVFLKASINNKATTVHQHFENAVKEYGWPSRVRVDKGGENTLVCDAMLRYHGAGRGSAIRGKSVHNIRIERLWVDVWNGSTNVFYDLFCQFEANHVLDPNSDEQMFALHYVYLPRIQKSLDDFTAMWNHHTLRTAKSSPLQLFVQRSLELQHSANTAMRDMFRQTEEPDNDANGESANSEPENEDNLTIVNIPETIMPITADHYQLLQSRINPLPEANEIDKGLNKYFEVLDLIDDTIANVQ